MRITTCLLILLCAGCTSWQEQKALYIDDINELLHKRYPKALSSGEETRLLACYVDGESTPGQALERDSIAEFGNVARASLVLTRVEPVDEEAVHAEGELQVHGLDRWGQRRSLVEQVEFHCVPRDGAWAIEEERVTDSRSHTNPPVTFRSEAVARGLWNYAAFGRVIDRNGEFRRYPGASGLAIGDIDDDGWDDVYFVNGSDCRLFRNLQNGEFAEVTDDLGVECDGEGLSRMALIADFDNDGRNDIFVGVLYGPNLYFRQRDDGTFEEAADEVGLFPTVETTGGVAADFNDDGWLDIFVLNGGNPHALDPEPPHDALNAMANVLFLANGDGTFRDATDEAGLGHRGWGLSCAVADYDADGDSDLYVGNDFGFDVLWANRGDGTFEDVTAQAGLRTRRSTMSSCWGDLDGDGRPEFFGGCMYSNSKWFAHQSAYPAPAPWPVSMLFRQQVIDVVDEMLAGNLFYLNRPDGSFELAYPETVKTGWSWSSVFFDCDNDSYLDVYLVNGFVSGTVTDDL